MQDKQQDVLDKISDLYYLPTIAELKIAFPLKESFPTDRNEFPWVNPRFTQFQFDNNTYQVYTQEFISSLSRYILERVKIYNLPEIKILEVGAGDGRLTHFLHNNISKHKANIQLIAIDNKDWEKKKWTHSNDKVIKMGYLEALKKYNPTIVISCWMNIEVNWTFDFINTPSVQEYLLIGDVFRTAGFGAGWYLHPGSDFQCQKLTRNNLGKRHGLIKGSYGRFDGSPFNTESKTEVYSFIRNTKTTKE